MTWRFFFVWLSVFLSILLWSNDVFYLLSSIRNTFFVLFSFKKRNKKHTKFAKRNDRIFFHEDNYCHFAWLYLWTECVINYVIFMHNIDWLLPFYSTDSATKKKDFRKSFSNQNVLIGMMTHVHVPIWQFWSFVLSLSMNDSFQ